MHSFTICDMYERNAKSYREQTALVSGDVRLSFGELLTRTRELASGMAERGISKGDRIAILAHNHPDFFLIFGAAAALGAITVPVNWRLSDEEIGYILTDAGTSVLITDKNHRDRIRDGAAKFPHMEIWEMNDADSPAQGTPAIRDIMLPKQLSPVSLSADDPFCLIYTAAVDGKPRGAVLSHGNIVYANMQTAATMGLTGRDAYLNMLPIFHITGLNLAFAVMHMAGKNVVIPKFDEKQTLEQTQAEKITVWGSFPPMLSRLTAEISAGNYDISCLRHVLGIDGPDNIRPFEEKTGSVFWILYGQTETSGLVTFSPALEKPGTAGKPGLLTKVRLVDEKENEVSPGETGEITVQGPLVFQGFWKQEKSTQHTFRNGWHHTGDLGQTDAEGYLIFKGRKPEKELIKPGGENVYPAEVESVILEHPAVREVSVIGVPDPKFGEGIKAICVLEDGADLTLKELGEFVAARIARYKKPQYAQFVKELPKKADGSVDREKVKVLYGTD
ncbi:MAG: AMP-binding protein [Desulfococcaceae bacterium]